MQYGSLVGREFNSTGFDYFGSNWPESNNLGSGRNGKDLFKVEFHKICDTPGPFLGIECVYEKVMVSSKEEYFIYPISELERTGQIKKEIYEIY